MHKFFLLSFLFTNLLFNYAHGVGSPRMTSYLEVRVQKNDVKYSYSQQYPILSVFGNIYANKERVSFKHHSTNSICNTPEKKLALEKSLTNFRFYLESFLQEAANNEQITTLGDGLLNQLLREKLGIFLSFLSKASLAYYSIIVGYFKADMVFDQSQCELLQRFEKEYKNIETSINESRTSLKDCADVLRMTFDQTFSKNIKDTFEAIYRFCYLINSEFKDIQITQKIENKIDEYFDKKFPMPKLLFEGEELQ